MAGLTVRFEAAKSINDIFNCLWQYKKLQTYPARQLQFHRCTLLTSVNVEVRKLTIFVRFMKLTKNYLRTTMLQDRLVDVARLGIEHELTNSTNFDILIQNFARRKARKVL